MVGLLVDGFTGVKLMVTVSVWAAAVVVCSHDPVLTPGSFWSVQDGFAALVVTISSSDETVSPELVFGLTEVEADHV